MNPNQPVRGSIPFYMTTRPSEPVRLYEGQIGIRQGAYSGTGNGVVDVVWRVLGPELRFQVPSLLPVDSLNPADCILTAPLIQGDIPALLCEVNQSGGDQGRSVGVSGRPNRNIVTGSEKQVARVVFHVVNFWGYLNPRPDPARSDYHIGRVAFEGGGWKVTLQSADHLRDLEAEIRNNSSFGITHVGQAERVDGASFSRAEAQKLFHCLHAFLSFARGLWSPPILYVGTDASGTPLWQDWTVRQASPWREVLSWFPSHQPECLRALFPGFIRLWQNPDTRGILEVSIHWYIEANLGAGAVEGAVILSQTGLERLAYYIMVHDRRLLTEQNFQQGPGRLSAAERLRRLFNEFALPVAIGPVRLRINALPALAASQGWVDAPDGLVRLRNSIVHPDAHNLQRLQTFPVNARMEAWTLCLWYYEVVLLKWCGYSGAYVNRQTIEYTCQTELVP